MRTMIEDVLSLASAGGQLHLDPVDLNTLAHAIIEDLDSPIRTHGARVTVKNLPIVIADATQLRVLFQKPRQQRPEIPQSRPPLPDRHRRRSTSARLLSAADAEGLAPPEAEVGQCGEAITFPSLEITAQH
jgi:hypothetical protein